MRGKKKESVPTAQEPNFEYLFQAMNVNAVCFNMDELALRAKFCPIVSDYCLLAHCAFGLNNSAM